MSDHGNHANNPIVRTIDWCYANHNRLYLGLLVLCVLLALVDITYEKHVMYDAERFVGAYALFGFLIYGAVVFAAKALRRLIRRDEDYYAPFTIDSEPAEEPDEPVKRVEPGHD